MLGLWRCLVYRDASELAAEAFSVGPLAVDQACDKEALLSAGRASLERFWCMHWDSISVWGAPGPSPSPALALGSLGELPHCAQPQVLLRVCCPLFHWQLAACPKVSVLFY